jgi:hypothetical protein
MDSGDTGVSDGSVTVLMTTTGAVLHGDLKAGASAPINLVLAVAKATDPHLLLP